ncbi:MAG TPA: YlzJ-like family protein, partial [Limnochordia bacterium]
TAGLPDAATARARRRMGALIYYTVIPPEALFGEWLEGRAWPEETAARGEGTGAAAIWRTAAGVPVLAQAIQGGRRIVQVLSTDPADFLDPALQPGAAVDPFDGGRQP